MDQQENDNKTIYRPENIPNANPGWSNQPVATVEEKHRSPWKTAGIIIGAILAVCGFIFIGLVVLFMVAMSSYGSNK
jgi:ABC-type Fe3+-siderophore transport system permease subunit